MYLTPLNPFSNRFSFLVYLIVCCTLLGCTGTSSSDLTNTREVIDFNNNWRFTKDSLGISDWVNIQVPHTVNIEPLVVNDMWQGTSWYEKNFELASNGKRAFVNFEGVMHEADVWVNDQKLVNHVGGYLPFAVDITDQIKPGESNVIRVRVNNQDNPVIPPGKALEVLDFNYYGGIYRDVRLEVKNEVHITNAVYANTKASGGLLIHFTEISEPSAKGIVQVHAKNSSNQPQNLSFKATLGTQPIESQSTLVAANKEVTLTQEIELPNPQFWSPQNPNLYEVKVQLMADNKTVDEVIERVGVRDIELTDDGFLLNGEEIFIRGTNRHQEYPYIGYALSDRAQYRDAVKIKNAGFDMVRLSHYPQDEAFLEACDELGLIVMNAIPGWQYYGGEEFLKNTYQDIRDMVRRDRNHASVFFWEVSLNESGMTDDYMIKVNEILKEELPFDDVYSVGWLDHESYDIFIPARQHSKAPDYWNFYKEGKRKIFIAEYGDWEYYAHNAGFNQKAFADLTETERTSRQLRGHGEKRLLQQALNFQEAANSNRKGVGTIGDANWVMFDYNRGYADDLESSGISDIFRIPKFVYSFYQSQRLASEKYNFSGNETGPMVSIANYWTDQSPTDVRVYSNAEEVALYLNNELIEKKSATTDIYSSHLDFPPFVFEVGAFSAGELRAEAFINGDVVAEDIVRTPGEPVGLALDIDLSGVPLALAEGDVIFVYAKVVDRNGTLVVNDEHEIEFSVEGEDIQLIGPNPVKAEAGIASILLRTESFKEDITIKAKSEDIVVAELKVSGQQVTM